MGLANGGCYRRFGTPPALSWMTCTARSSRSMWSSSAKNGPAGTTSSPTRNGDRHVAEWWQCAVDEALTTSPSSAVYMSTIGLTGGVTATVVRGRRSRVVVIMTRPGLRGGHQHDAASATSDRRRGL